MRAMEPRKMSKGRGDAEGNLFLYEQPNLTGKRRLSNPWVAESEKREWKEKKSWPSRGRYEKRRGDRLGKVKLHVRWGTGQWRPCAHKKNLGWPLRGEHYCASTTFLVPRCYPERRYLSPLGGCSRVPERQVLARYLGGMAGMDNNT